MKNVSDIASIKNNIKVQQCFNMLLSLAIIFFLNLVDSFFTIVYVDILGFQELNPVVAPLFIWGPLAFISWKMFMITMCCIIICMSWMSSRKQWVQKFINVVIAVYSILALAHIAILIRLLSVQW